MGFELGRLVREAAGGLGARVVEKARELRRRAHAEAGRVWKGAGELMRVRISVELGAAKEPTASTEAELNESVGPKTSAVVEIMAEALSLSGYGGVRADVAGRLAPEVVRGTIRSHRPSLTATGGGRSVLVDVFCPGEADPDEQFSRWQLFASAAAQCGGEFHVVVPAWVEGAAGAEWVRRITDGTPIAVTKIWEV